MTSIFLTGIHTGVGKTISAAIVATAYKLAYWKPVQAGLDDETDMATINKLNTTIITHSSQYNLQLATSPHYAAKEAKLPIHLPHFNFPQTSNLLIEGAGGLLSPLGTDFTNLDFALYYKLPIILVIMDYLGCINHSLLCLEVLEKYNAPLLGVIFVGKDTTDVIPFITSRFKINILGNIPIGNQINSKFIIEHSKRLKNIDGLDKK